MPQRMIVSTLLLPGALVVLLLLLVRRDPHALAQTGPRWRRRLLAAGLALLGWLSLGGCGTADRPDAEETDAIVQTEESDDCEDDNAQQRRESAAAAREKEMRSHHATVNNWLFPPAKVELIRLTHQLRQALLANQADSNRVVVINTIDAAQVTATADTIRALLATLDDSPAYPLPHSNFSPQQDHRLRALHFLSAIVRSAQNSRDTVQNRRYLITRFEAESIAAGYRTEYPFNSEQEQILNSEMERLPIAIEHMKAAELLNRPEAGLLAVECRELQDEVNHYRTEDEGMSTCYMPSFALPCNESAQRLQARARLLAELVRERVLHPDVVRELLPQIRADLAAVQAEVQHPVPRDADADFSDETQQLIDQYPALAREIDADLRQIEQRCAAR